MDKPTLHDILYEYAAVGYADTQRNLYPKQELALLKDGFSVQRIGTVPDYPEQSRCLISWKNTIEGTYAYELLQQAAKIHPELLL